MTESVRRYVEEDRGSFINLHRDIFDSDMSSELFNWKYQQAPKAKDPPVVVAEKNNSIVGAVGSFLVPFNINHKYVLGSRPVDIMIEEEHRSHKLFIDLVERLRDLYPENVAFEFGTGVRETRKAWERFGGWEYDSIDRHIRIQRPGKSLGEDVTPVISYPIKVSGLIYRSLLKIWDKISELKISSYAVHKESEYVQAAFNSTNVKDEYPVSIERDADYWEWRAADPRIEMSTYWTGSVDNPIASVLIATEKSGERRNCRIALQDNRNGDIEPLISIYKKILKDHTEYSRIQYTNNKPDGEFVKRVGLNHGKIIEKINKRNIIGKLLRVLNKNVPVEEINGEPVGYLWLDSDIEEYKPREWEYSDLTSD